MLKIVILSILCVFVNAHSLKAFVKNDGEFVNLKAYFYGNSPCAECEVEILKNGEIIDKFKTDSDGKAKFKITQSEFEIHINGGLGHEKRINFRTNFNDTAPNLQIQNNEKNSRSIDQIQNLQNSANFENDDKKFALKFALSFLIIFCFFGLLYITKKKR